ncbi:hypothetical protein [Streptomyces graminofaciens]|nr:hypothetical protein [Streptomyces graminofaciens]
MPYEGVRLRHEGQREFPALREGPDGVAPPLVAPGHKGIDEVLVHG